MSELITVPNFVFNQGDIFSGEMEDTERPIYVKYYHGSIVLAQDGDFDQQESIIISPKHIQKLFREIKKHLPEAEYWWKKS